jgi:glycosyltransferase involved in cell wall biosynthesis
MTRRGVIFDLVAAQSPSYRGRGIARYSTELVRAMVQYHPELVSSIVVHPELGPIDGTDDLAEWLTTSPDWAEGSVLHMGSVIEPEVPVRVYWPREASAHRLYTAVTLYDLIPELFPGWYLQDPGLRRRWRCCLEVVRQADAILTLSASTKQDTIGLLGVPEERVAVVGGGTSPVFQRPESRKEAFKVARKGVKGLKEGFIVYNGAFNPRKGVDNLIEGYASLPSELIRRYQLVIVCEAPPLTRNHYLVMAKRLGVEDRLLIPGYVPEEVLVSLYQCAELAIFPSLYEGYGLPVEESMACGAPTMAGDNSSLQEILPRDARFQPSDPGAIAEAIARGLTDKPFRDRLLALASQPPPTWGAVADKAVAVFEEMSQKAGRFRPGWRRRPQLALVGVPAELADAISAYASVDRYVSHAHGNGDEGALPLAALRKLDPWRGGYDAIIGWLPGTEGPDAEVVEQLAAEWPGRVVALFDQEHAGADRRPFSTPGVSTIAVFSEPSSWAETARRVAEAAQGKAR